MPVTVSVLFFGLIIFRPIWERYPGGLWNVLFFFGIVVLFFCLIINIIKETIRVFRLRNKLTIHILIPVLMMTMSLLGGIFNPLNINLDFIYGKVNFRACYEGTQNQATLKLRDNGKFDIHSTGVFFSDYFYLGTYKRTGDTIYLKYNNEIPGLFGDTLLIRDEYLFTIQQDTIKETYFYLGYCKGLN